MSVRLKDPDAVLDYSIDWADALEEGEALSTAEWLIAPQLPGGLAIASESAVGAVHTAVVSGGRPGDLYRLTNRVTTDQGRTHDLSFLIRIAEK